MYLLPCQLEKKLLLIFWENYENSKGEIGGKPNMTEEMSKKVYEEMVKEMNIISSNEEPSLQQRA